MSSLANLPRGVRSSDTVARKPVWRDFVVHLRKTTAAMERSLKAVEAAAKEMKDRPEALLTQIERVRRELRCLRAECG
jgi:hypothetical protein